MKLTRTRSAALVGGALIAVLAMAYLRDPAPNAAEKKVMEQYTKDMRSVCFGRFVMDVPQQAELTNGQMGYVFAEFQIDDKLKNLTQFNLAVDFKIEDLKKKAPYVERPMYYFDEMVGPSVRIVNQFTDERGDYFTPKAFVFLDGATIQIEGAETNKKEKYEQGFKAKLLDLLPRLRKLPEGEMPKEPGFCMVGAYVAGMNKNGENADLVLSLKGHPDFSFGVRTTVIDRARSEPMLIDREAGIVSQMGSLMKGVKTLRKRKFQINGQEAQEWSVALPEARGVEYKFHVEVRGVPNSSDQPEMDISMSVGGDGVRGWVPASLSEAEALAVWDALLNSIKLRPGAP